MYQPWKDRWVFETVRVGQYGEVVWYIPGAEQGLYLCPDALYMELAGLTLRRDGGTAGNQTTRRIRQWRRRRWANAGPLAKRLYRLQDRWLS